MFIAELAHYSQLSSCRLIWFFNSSNTDELNLSVHVVVNGVELVGQLDEVVDDDAREVVEDELRVLRGDDGLDGAAEVVDGDAQVAAHRRHTPHRRRRRLPVQRLAAGENGWGDIKA